MAKLPLTKIGNEVLRTPCALVDHQKLHDADFQKWIKDMVETMRAAHGVGLAANQVGVGLQVIMLECKANPRYEDEKSIPLEVYLNPRIVEKSKETEDDWEGCLSIPGYRGLTPRSLSITFKATTMKGERVEKTVHGFEARILQHEIDHIQGFFYMDRMKDLTAWKHLEEFNRSFGTDVHE